MDQPKKATISVPALIVLYDFQYTAKDRREICMRKGEKLYLIEKTNKDWWQVVRQSERRSFYVPAQYVELVSKEKLPLEYLDVSSANRHKEKVEYENIKSLKSKHEETVDNSSDKVHCTVDSVSRLENEIPKSAQANKQKPVPKTRTKVSGSKISYDIEKASKHVCEDSNKLPAGEKSETAKYIGMAKSELNFSLPKNSEQLTNLIGEPERHSVNHLHGPDHLAKSNLPTKSSSPAKGRAKISHTLSDNEQIDNSKNRMKSSYNLKVKPSKSFEIHQKNSSKFSRNDSVPMLKSDNNNLSKSLEKLAQEIKFQPKTMDPETNLSKTLIDRHADSDELSKDQKTKEPAGEDSNSVKKERFQNVQEQVCSQSKGSVFSRIRRSLHHNTSFKSHNLKKSHKGDNKGCELSLSWEGGLDKALELEKTKAAQISNIGLQRSRTFMVAERSPTVFRHVNSIHYGRNRVEIAYHSQKLYEAKNILSTFKPAVKQEPKSNLNTRAKYSSGGIRSPIPNKRCEEKCFLLKEDDMESEEKYMMKGCQKEALSEVNAFSKSSCENMTPWELNSKASSPTENRAVASVEAFSQSESEDNSELKNLSASAEAQENLFMNQSSIDSNLTQSEGTELSESDENGSLDLDAEMYSKEKEPLSKRRSSLMRNRRVTSSKSRALTTRQLPPTPAPEERPTRDLGDGWGVYNFSDKRTYYYNRTTGERSWKPPRRNLTRQENRNVGSRESICSDTSGSVICSSTSSPSNDRILSNSLNRSNASLSSRSMCYDNPGYDIVKSSSGCDLKEETEENLNRSLNSSPATCQSRSSSYSFIKSSRDSLNRSSPIENIPSEEDDIELQDHVYQEDVRDESKKECFEKISEKYKSKMGEEQDDGRLSTGMSIPPGWTEYYDEATSQFFFIHKETKQKWFTSFDPEGRLYFFDELSNESSWALPNISADGSDSKYSIQRSATESAVPKDHPERFSSDGEKRRSRMSSCSRSAKTQSMVIEPKLDFSGTGDGKTLSMPRDLTKMYGEIIRSGMLNKTKISENGKKLRKNWTPSFVVLSNTKLLFFKDAKTFHSTKPANDCMCLNLKGAVIEKGDKISSKKNVYKVNSADHVEVLIQTDRTSDAEEWYRDINSVIQNLPLEPADTSKSQADPSSPSNIGRAKSVKGKNREGGSMEDLSFSQEERQNKIKAKLKKFFHRRPTVDSLKKKGIWKDEPVFGCSLEQITKNRNPRVPVFVEKCIECIESKEENLKTDGLYRASGNLSQVQKIRLEVDQNNLGIMREEEDVHVLTGSLKLFFRELKDPLIPFKQLVPALTALNNPKRKEKIREYRKIVGTLPGPNYDTLKFLLQHLLRVERYNEFNRMNVNNLAIVFGPTLMWPEQESTNMALDFMQQNLVIECLLREFQDIFI